MKAKSGFMHRGHGSLDVGSLTPNGLGGNETRREKLFSSFFLSFGDTCRCHFFFYPSPSRKFSGNRKSKLETSLDIDVGALITGNHQEKKVIESTGNIRQFTCLIGVISRGAAIRATIRPESKTRATPPTGLIRLD